VFGFVLSLSLSRSRSIVVVVCLSALAFGLAVVLLFWSSDLVGKSYRNRNKEEKTKTKGKTNKLFRKQRSKEEDALRIAWYDVPRSVFRFLFR